MQLKAQFTYNDICVPWVKQSIVDNKYIDHYSIHQIACAVSIDR